MSPTYESLSLQPRWKLEQPDPKWATQFVVQRFVPGREVVLTFGVLAPVIYGTEQEQQDQATRLSDAGADGIQTVARLVMSEPVARELHRVLGEQLESGVKS